MGFFNSLKKMVNTKKYNKNSKDYGNKLKQQYEVKSNNYDNWLIKNYGKDSDEYGTWLMSKYGEDSNEFDNWINNYADKGSNFYGKWLMSKYGEGSDEYGTWLMKNYEGSNLYGMWLMSKYGEGSDEYGTWLMKKYGEGSDKYGKWLMKKYGEDSNEFDNWINNYADKGKWLMSKYGEGSDKYGMWLIEEYAVNPGECDSWVNRYANKNSNLYGMWLMSKYGEGSDEYGTWLMKKYGEGSDEYGTWLMKKYGEGSYVNWLLDCFGEESDEYNSWMKNKYGVNSKQYVNWLLDCFGEESDEYDSWMKNKYDNLQKNGVWLKNNKPELLIKENYDQSSEEYKNLIKSSYGEDSEEYKNIIIQEYGVYSLIYKNWMKNIYGEDSTKFNKWLKNYDKNDMDSIINKNLKKLNEEKFNIEVNTFEELTDNNEEAYFINYTLINKSIKKKIKLSILNTKVIIENLDDNYLKFINHKIPNEKNNVCIDLNEKFTFKDIFLKKEFKCKNNIIKVIKIKFYNHKTKQVYDLTFENKKDHLNIEEFNSPYLLTNINIVDKFKYPIQSSIKDDDFNGLCYKLFNVEADVFEGLTDNKEDALFVNYIITNKFNKDLTFNILKVSLLLDSSDLSSSQSIIYHQLSNEEGKFNIKANDNICFNDMFLEKGFEIKDINLIRNYILLYCNETKEKYILEFNKKLLKSISIEYEPGFINNQVSKVSYPILKTSISDNDFKGLDDENFDLEINFSNGVTNNGDTAFFVDYNIINQTTDVMTFSILNTLLTTQDQETYNYIKYHNENKKGLIYDMNDSKYYSYVDENVYKKLNLKVNPNGNTTFKDVFLRHTSNDERFNSIEINLYNHESEIKYSLKFSVNLYDELKIDSVDFEYVPNSYIKLPNEKEKSTTNNNDILESVDEKQINNVDEKQMSNANTKEDNLKLKLLDSIERLPQLESKTGIDVENLSIKISHDSIYIFGDFFLEDSKNHRGIYLNITCYDKDNSIIGLGHKFISFNDFLGFESFDIWVNNINPKEINKIRFYPSYSY